MADGGGVCRSVLVPDPRDGAPTPFLPGPFRIPPSSESESGEPMTRAGHRGRAGVAAVRPKDQHA